MALPDAPIGLQLYTLREHLGDARAAATLAEVRRLGYAHVEPMDTEQLARIAPPCRDLDLGLRSCFYNWTITTGNRALLAAVAPEAAPTHTLDDAIAAALDAGVTDLVFGYLLPPERETPDDYRRVADQVNRDHAAIRAAGLVPCYHHHAFEFEPLGADGLRGWDILTERVDWSVTRLQVDMFWLAVAGVDAVRFVGEHAARLRSVHLKDLAALAAPAFDERAVAPTAFRAVGAGVLDVAGFVAAAGRAGAVHYIVEQDASPDALADVATSLRSLRARE